VPTVDVIAQERGPRLAMSEWVAYWDTPDEARKSLLDAPALLLSSTPMDGGAVRPPSAVAAVDLASIVWPPDVLPRPAPQVGSSTPPRVAYSDGKSCES
jgi:hypothetical protein